MKFTFLFVAVLFAEADRPLDFDTDILPILSKAGCNAASCHGAAVGRGGLKLSLFGGNPAADYSAIVHELESRRVNWLRPAESLLLLKPTGQVDHEGGLRFDYDSSAAGAITDWIGQGAKRLSRKIVELELTPSTVVATEIPATFSVAVKAKFADGEVRDVTDVTVFQVSDAEAIVERPGGSFRVLRRGRHHLIVRYLGHVKSLPVTVPFDNGLHDEVHAVLNGENRHRSDRRPPGNWIDNHIDASLADLRLPPSGQADDATLLRRLTLDLIGRLPPPELVTSYTADSDPAKYSRLVDRLLESPEFSEYWTYKLAKWLRIGGNNRDTAALNTYYQWLRNSIERRRSLAELAAELVLGEGDTHQVGPANFYRSASDARQQAELFSEVFLGIRLRCANCHNHPLDRWTQDDYHGLAAIFARVERGRIVREVDFGDVVHPRTSQAAVMRIPGKRYLNDDEQGRRALAAWVSDEQNDQLARAFVNRLWKSMMGRGFVEPPDDLRATNPATHPELFTRLSRDFADGGFELRHTLRQIAMSAAYRRSSRGSEWNRHDRLFYSHALTRPLEPEVLADAICDVTGIPESFANYPSGTRAVTLVDPQVPSIALDVLGRCPRRDSCEGTDPSTRTGLSAMLHLTNGPLVNRRLSDRAGHLSRMIGAGERPEAMIREFYVRALSRLPSEDERQFWHQQLDDTREPRQTLEDFVWALLMSQEFGTNH